MKTQGELKQAKDTIHNWLESKSYPQDFLYFFFQWTLLNLYYNALSQENEEIQRVLEFGRVHEKIFDRVKKSASDILKNECVGNGIYDAPPSSWVKTASKQLRERLGLSQHQVCRTCREEKRMRCEGVNYEHYAFVNMEALMRVLYQIRCNLFHGEKTEHSNGEQAKRNRKLVKVSNQILEQVLNFVVGV